MNKRMVTIATGVTLGASTIFAILMAASIGLLLLSVALGGGSAGYSIEQGNLPPTFWTSVVCGGATLAIALAGFIQAMKRNLGASLLLNLSAVALTLAFPPFAWFAI